MTTNNTVNQSNRLNKLPNIYTYRAYCGIVNFLFSIHMMMQIREMLWNFNVIFNVKYYEMMEL